jgi:NTE family protein
MLADLVFEGGGAKIPGFVGAYRALIDAGFSPSRVAGTSSGSLFASLIAAGYTVPELTQSVLTTDFSLLLKDKFFSKARNLFGRYGLYRGNALEDHIWSLLRHKGVVYFGDLKNPDEKDPRLKYRLRVVVTDLTNERLVVFPDHAHLYGLDPDRMLVSQAVRASCSIPLFFEPVKIQGAYLVDGGLLSNFPIWMYDSPGEPAHPTFGFLLDEGKDSAIINSLPKYGLALANTVRRAFDSINLRPEEYANRTIRIPVGGVRATDFSLSTSRKLALIKGGHEAATNFLRTWSWDVYREWAISVRSTRYWGGDNILLPPK